MNIEIKKLTNNETDHFLQLLHIFNNVFEWDNFSNPNPLQLKRLLDNKFFIVFIAIADDVVVGGLTAYILERYDSEKPSAYIYDIAVTKEMQRNGIGKSLIEKFIAYCNDQKFSEVFVQAESEDTHAINFYKKTPISSELHAVHFTYLLDKYKL
ncbi:MAG: GNAT family N-acetyltransferase [Bacteroidota bacterium]